MADGLGHGEQAAHASRLAVSVFEAHPELGPGAALDAVHHALHASRGAAAAIAEIDIARREVRFAGVGNISGIIISMSREHNMVSHNGTVGHEARRIQEFAYAWPESAVMVLHSDGISKRWRLDECAGLSTRAPLLIAGVLYRDYGREHDDLGVVVVKDVPAGSAR
jgi:Stage II sporulation protein E (SpoIIE)